jgi:hypothetical protein
MISPYQSPEASNAQSEKTDGTGQMGGQVNSRREFKEYFMKLARIL